MSIVNRWVGPMPVDDFLKDFVPEREDVIPPPVDGHYFKTMLDAMTKEKPEPKPKSKPKLKKKGVAATLPSIPEERSAEDFSDSDDDELEESVLPVVSDYSRKEFRIENDMYNPFITCVEKGGLMPRMEIFNTSVASDPNHREGRDIKIDAMVYDRQKDEEQKDQKTRKKERKRTSKKHRARFNRARLMAEFKLRLDPFKDLEGKGNFVAESHASEGFRFDITGQLADYATEWHVQQHRCFSFMLLMIDTGFRLIRLDRDGFIVTEFKEWSSQEGSTLLADFLWRFDGLTPEQQGQDPTVSVVADTDKKAEELILKNLVRWRIYSKAKETPPMLRIEVPTGDPAKPIRTVLAWYAITEGDFLCSRATRGYPVVDEETEKVMFLKDTWRPNLEGMTIESDILRHLNSAGVRNVPTLIGGGDIPGQTTLTPAYAQAAWRSQKDRDPDEQPWHYRVHHRLLEDFIGLPLVSFKSSAQLLKVVHDAFIGHKDAYVKCGIIHRDVSAGNIMLMEEPGRENDLTGVLIDWEMAVYENALIKPKRSRKTFRTGTWAFMSSAVLKNPTKLHTIQDDMESFFWVVMYHGLRYLEHTHPSERLFDDLHHLFEESYISGNMELGGTAKAAFLEPQKHPFGLGFGFASVPLTAWMHHTSAVIQEWYAYLRGVESYELNVELQKIVGTDYPLPKPPQKEEQLFRSHDAMDSRWKDILALPKDKWPQKETMCYRCSKKRGHSEADEGQGKRKKPKTV